MNRVKLSVVAPAYNEEEGIEFLIEKWINYLKGSSKIYEFEICICNDKSTDNTWNILQNLKNKHVELKIESLSKNSGAAYALFIASRMANYDYVLLIDSDDQYPIENLEVYINAITNNVDAVIGYRSRKNDNHFMRVGSYVSSRLCNKIFGTNFIDFNCALKLIRRDRLFRLKVEAKGLNYSADYLAKMIDDGLRIVEVPVISQSRIYGKSSARFLKDAYRRLLYVTYLWYKQFLKSQNIIF